jgi:hypothetical protein
MMRSSDGVLKSAVASRSSDGGSSRAALLAAPKAAFGAPRIETWRIGRACWQLGWCTEERRTELKCRRRIIASCLVGCAQGSIGSPLRIETGGSDRVVAQLGWCTEERRTEPEFRWTVIASCLVGCAQGSVGAHSDRELDDPAGCCRIGWRSKERRGEPKFRRRIIASCLVGCAQGSVRSASDRKLDHAPSGRSRSESPSAHAGVGEWALYGWSRSN